MNVMLICGPPGSGKTSYVKAHKRWGDLVIDRDWILMAISGEDYYDNPEALRPLAEAARSAIIGRMRSSVDISTAWVIIGGARIADRDRWRTEYNAKVIMLEVSPNECVRRITSDERRKDKYELWQPIVARWWDRYERDERDTIVI